MKFTDWSKDANARAVYRQIENALAPTLAVLMPEYNMVELGILQPDFCKGDGVVRLVVHLKPNGLCMSSERDPMDQFNYGDLESVKAIGGIGVKRLK
jgi:hypothetical protein